MARWLMVIVLVLSGAAGGIRMEPTVDGLNRLRWLAGCWEMRSGPRSTIEMWMPPAGGLMLGASRTVAGEQVVEYEQLQLGLSGDRLVYTATPARQSQASFTATMFTDSSFVVENLAHDFPQRIIYRRRGVDSLVARIEGPGSDGTKGFDYAMTRVSCEAR